MGMKRRCSVILRKKGRVVEKNGRFIERLELDETNTLLTEKNLEIKINISIDSL